MEVRYMKLNLKRVLMTLALLGILLALSLGAFSAAASSDDPAEGYVPTAAANEDAGLKLWFEHSFKKVLTKDTTPRIWTPIPSIWRKTR